MRATVLTLCVCALLSTPALAGKNAGGGLMVHTDDAVNFTFFGTPDYCAIFETLGLNECADLDTRSDFVDPLLGALVYLVADFPVGSSPGVTVIYFGIEHNLGPGVITAWDFCGPAGSLELPDSGWPDDWASAGNSLAFGLPMTGDLLFPFYWFGVYGDAGDFIGTGINPTGGYAAFVSDDIPGILDEIWRFGRVRWFEPGFNDCPIGGPEACCFSDGSCLYVHPGECVAQGGIPWGAGTNCDPNPCPQPWACCFEDGTCIMMTAADCFDAGGFFLGEPVTCEPINPCEPAVGACCFPDGFCELMWEIDCGENLWLQGETCEPNPCPQPEACCFETGECELLLVEDCEAAGGEPQGEGTDCDPNLCEPIVIEDTTWGSIKVDYR